MLCQCQKLKVFHENDYSPTPLPQKDGGQKLGISRYLYFHLLQWGKY